MKTSIGPSAGATRRRLLARTTELRADIQRELAKCDDERYNELADRVADSGEQAVADLLVDVDLAEVTRDVEELREVEAALLRLAHGTYGTCVDCAAPIDVKRLAASPSAARCVPCQERHEKRSGAKKHVTL